MTARRRQSPARQWITLVLLVLFMIGTAWLVQYVLIKASGRPRPPAASAPR